MRNIGILTTNVDTSREYLADQIDTYNALAQTGVFKTGDHFIMLRTDNQRWRGKSLDEIIVHGNVPNDLIDAVLAECIHTSG